MSLLLTLDTLLFDPKEFSFLTGMTFRGLTVSQSQDGWNVTLRAFVDDMEAVYAMTCGPDPHQALSTLLAALATRNGNRLWHRDKYYKG